MLILTRKNGESIVIGEDIELKVLEVYDGRVKIGIDAPKDIRVLRKEVLDVIEQNLEASKLAVDKSKLETLMTENKKK